MKTLVPYPDKSAHLRSQWLVDYALSCGITTAEMREVLVPDAAPEPEWKKLPMLSYMALFNWLATRLDNESLALDLLGEVDMSYFGGGAALAYHVSTLQECCECLARYAQTVSKELSVNFFSRSDEESVIEYIPTHMPNVDVTQEVVMSTALLVKFFRSHLGDDWCPVRVLFPFKRPRDVSRYKQVFGKDISFSSHVAAVWIRADELKAKISNGDPYLLEVLRSHTEELYRQIQRERDVLSRTKHFIAQNLGSENCNAVYVAQQLFMSRRSLTRWLSDRSTSFRELKNEVTMEIAKKTLSETSCFVDDIAVQLGYSEASAFYRAFKKSTGYSPMEYRDRFFDS
ncbi:AraC family transcriptional regulator [Microbulbifer agarilyticus]|uniref:AraC family transcriptional regulator n=1 Tax=Microbulbifer agarilyticus TaxID=260552 RepID=UPI001CD56495|nr:AraC family transcriptional regulator [Microbulbifer agarilyticus]MCA0899537.1 AraC family transcriptional regulator [Microbulbifer agarilyticus]